MDLVLMRESVPYISASLANVINKALKSGVFKQDWKNVRMTPISKDDGDINDENYFFFGRAWFFYFNGSICLFEKTLHPN